MVYGSHENCPPLPKSFKPRATNCRTPCNKRTPFGILHTTKVQDETKSFSLCLDCANPLILDRAELVVGTILGCKRNFHFETSIQNLENRLHRKFGITFMAYELITLYGALLTMSHTKEPPPVFF